MKYLAGIMVLIFGAASLYVAGEVSGPAKQSILPMKMMGVALIATGVAVFFSRPAESPAYASTRRRIAATLIDTLIFMLVSIPLNQFGNRLPLGLFLPLFTLAVFAFALMSVVGHARWGMTPGKFLMKIRVVRTDFSRIGIREALLRSSVDAVFAAFVFANFIRFILVFGYPEYQAAMGGHRRAELAFATPMIFLIASGLHNMWYVGEFAVMRLNGKRRATHDFIAGTVIVNGRTEESPNVEVEAR